MSRNKAEQKLFIVFLEMASGAVREVKVKASNSGVAGNRALKRVDSAVRVARVEVSS